MHANFSPAEHANLVAAKVVSHATAYLDGRNDADILARTARAVMCELVAVGEDLRAKPILDAARLLNIAMFNAAAARDDAIQDRWQQVMGALVELVRLESTKLRQNGVQRS